MSYFTTTINFSTGDQVTSDKLDQITTGMRLASQSVDGTTLTLTAGVLSLGTVTSTNLGALSVGTVALAADAVTGAKIADAAVDSEHYAAGSIDETHYADASLSFVKTKTADRAVKADMQSETAAKFPTPDVLKHHPGVAKAYGIVSFTDGSATVTGGYNVTSAAESGSDRIITLAVTMANTNYNVQATIEDTSTVANSLVITSKTTTGFTIKIGEGSGRLVAFTVHGQLA